MSTSNTPKRGHQYYNESSTLQDDFYDPKHRITGHRSPRNVKKEERDNLSEKSNNSKNNNARTISDQIDYERYSSSKSEENKPKHHRSHSSKSKSTRSRSSRSKNSRSRSSRSRISSSFLDDIDISDLTGDGKIVITPRSRLLALREKRRNKFLYTKRALGTAERRHQRFVLKPLNSSSYIQSPASQDLSSSSNQENITKDEDQNIKAESNSPSDNKMITESNAQSENKMIVESNFQSENKMIVESNFQSENKMIAESNSPASSSAASSQKNDIKNEKEFSTPKPKEKGIFIDLSTSPTSPVLSEHNSSNRDKEDSPSKKQTKKEIPFDSYSIKSSKSGKTPKSKKKRQLKSKSSDKSKKSNKKSSKENSPEIYSSSKSNSPQVNNSTKSPEINNLPKSNSLEINNSTKSNSPEINNSTKINSPNVNNHLDESIQKSLGELKTIELQFERVESFASESENRIKPPIHETFSFQTIQLDFDNKTEKSIRKTEPENDESKEYTYEYDTIGYAETYGSTSSIVIDDNENKQISNSHSYITITEYVLDDSEHEYQYEYEYEYENENEHQYEYEYEYEDENDDKQFTKEFDNVQNVSIAPFNQADKDNTNLRNNNHYKQTKQNEERNINNNSKTKNDSFSAGPSRKVIEKQKEIARILKQYAKTVNSIESMVSPKIIDSSSTKESSQSDINEQQIIQDDDVVISISPHRSRTSSSRFDESKDKTFTELFDQLTTEHSQTSNYSSNQKIVIEMNNQNGINQKEEVNTNDSNLIEEEASDDSNQDEFNNDKAQETKQPDNKIDQLNTGKLSIKENDIEIPIEEEESDDSNQVEFNKNDVQQNKQSNESNNELKMEKVDNKESDIKIQNEEESHNSNQGKFNIDKTEEIKQPNYTIDQLNSEKFVNKEADIEISIEEEESDDSSIQQLFTEDKTLDQIDTKHLSSKSLNQNSEQSNSNTSLTIKDNTNQTTENNNDTPNENHSIIQKDNQTESKLEQNSLNKEKVDQKSSNTTSNEINNSSKSLNTNSIIGNCDNMSDKTSQNQLNTEKSNQNRDSTVNQKLTLNDDEYILQNEEDELLVQSIQLPTIKENLFPPLNLSNESTDDSDDISDDIFEIIGKSSQLSITSLKVVIVECQLKQPTTCFVQLGIRQNGTVKDDESVSTKTSKLSMNPQFNEKFDVPIDNQSDDLSIKVFSCSYTTPQLIGKAYIPSSIFSINKPVKRSFGLTPIGSIVLSVTAEHNEYDKQKSEDNSQKEKTIKNMKLKSNSDLTSNEENHTFQLQFDLNESTSNNQLNTNQLSPNKTNQLNSNKTKELSPNKNNQLDSNISTSQIQKPTQISFKNIELSPNQNNQLTKNPHLNSIKNSNKTNELGKNKSQKIEFEDNESNGITSDFTLSNKDNTSDFNYYTSDYNEVLNEIKQVNLSSSNYNKSDGLEVEGQFKLEDLTHHFSLKEDNKIISSSEASPEIKKIASNEPQIMNLKAAIESDDFDLSDLDNSFSDS